MYKCTNCPWEGEDYYHYNPQDPASQKRMDGFCPVCGDKVKNVDAPVKEEEKQVVSEPVPEKILEPKVIKETKSKKKGKR